ncbi:MAG TPA: choice-of-anchor B family protein [Chitinophagales bacterium]|nr:choice-of-anchor B family protein [Chitinophagales bacterium]
MKSFLFLFALCISLTGTAQNNISLLGHLAYDNTTLCAGITGYADPAGHEYALICHNKGVSIVSIDTPSNPRELFMIPLKQISTVLNREVREYKGYAYVTSELADSLVIINLNYLPDSVTYHAVNPAGMSRAHTIFIDEKGIAFINSSNEGTLFLDLNADPYNPVYLGKFTNDYVHDCFVRNDTMWAACLQRGTVVLDVHDKTAANNASSVITEWTTPFNFTHNCWLSDDSRYIFTTDEMPGAPLACYDVSNLNNVTETDKIVVDSGSNTIIHNVTFMNDYCISGSYTYGVVIHDVSDKSNIVEVGHFDTSPNYSGDGFNGCWAAWPYLPSGNLICSDIETGLWILKAAYPRVARLEGIVTDQNNNLLNGVKVEILTTSASSYSIYTGSYKTGTTDTGTYTVRFSKYGYYTVLENNIHLSAGAVTSLNVTMQSIPQSKLVITTVDATTGAPVSNVQLLLIDSANGSSIQTVSNSSGQYIILYYDSIKSHVFAGKWGYFTSGYFKQTTLASDTLRIELLAGYYDDFTFDLGWQISSSATAGIWERTKPPGTLDSLGYITPGWDIAEDFFDRCYVTENAGNVNNGSTVLISPEFDLTQYVDPYISYYRWFTNTGGIGTPDDNMATFISNGLDTLPVLIVTADSIQRQWVYQTVRVRDYLQSTDIMRVGFVIADQGYDHTLEGAIDVFRIFDSVPNDLKQLPENNLRLAISPNPFSNTITALVTNANAEDYKLEISDAIGRKIYVGSLNSSTQTITLDAAMSNGIYFATLTQNGRAQKTVKLIRTDGL